MNFNSNTLDKNLDNYVSNEDHVPEYVDIQTIEYVNNKTEKTKSANKKKKENKKKDSLNTNKTPTKKVSTPTLA